MTNNPAFSSLAKRTLSSIVVVVVVVGSLLLSKYSFLALLAVIGVGALWEFYLIASKTGASPQKWLGISAGIAMIALFNVGYYISDFVSLGFSLMIALLFVVFICELYRKKENPLQNIAVTLMGIIYVGLPLSLLAQIILGGNMLAPYYILGFIILVWANDVGAYLIGVAFGKHRLFERVSPKKSWEGFFGGLTLAVIAGLLIAWGMKELWKADTSMFLWVGMAVVVVISGVFGDLVESLLKRSVMLKDSGDVIPGHGGFLDRFDAMLFAVPFVYLYFVIFGLWL